MQPKSHLFVVDDDTMPVHIQKGFCGIIKVSPKNSAGHINSAYYGQLADCMNIKENDLVYFYMQTKEKWFNFKYSDKFDKLEQGYYGVYKVVGKPFYSNQEIKGEYPIDNYYIFSDKSNPHYSSFVRTIDNSKKYPPILYIKIPIEPIENHGELENRFVDDNQAYIDKEDEGLLSTLLFKKIKRLGEERSITPILPEEASKIARLIFKQERRNFPLNIDRKNLIRNENPANEVTLELSSRDGDVLDSESMLEAYILNALNNNINLGILSEIIGNYDEIDFCGNQVQYGISGNKVDILLLHRKVLAGSMSYRYKATVIELKKDKLKEESITQIIDYQKWIAQLTTFNNKKAIQPILVGKKPSSRMAPASKKAIEKTLYKIASLEIPPPEFVEYSLIKNKQGKITSISFQKFAISTIINE